ncbi:uncharacterized protein [Spinacia oleracea]|uniref:Reverse transcriptase domain-containing protein n=1 Tax=Spinacia oleracea TaxID=3562 RepID=A0ABM3QXJ8_SPIOL|nr:uncharacterized protein LOC130463079 [Spinacia oleracea]
MWKSSPDFLSIIQHQWNKQFHGTKMYVVVNKLKQVKGALKDLNRVGFSDIQAADIKAFNDMNAAQQAMHLNPSDVTLADLELQAISEYRLKHQAYLDFLRQKAKMDWLKAGDENTTLFHQSIRQRRTLNQIYSIYDMHGNWKEDSTEVSMAFSEYYTSLLGTTQTNRKAVLSQVVQLGPLINDQHRAILNGPYTADEVRKALFSIPGVKAPGPDGFGTFFFKDSWSIVGDEVVAAVLDVLQQRKLLKELNHTVITLIPKIKCPNTVSDFRPISCCNTLYKCVTKVLCNRLRQILPDLIMENQGGFVHGRHIVHNIMVVQDLVKHYGRKDVKPSCLMKIDLQKAYDTVDWNFLQEMLEQLGFPEHFVHLVMECVTTPMFSLMINGTMHGFFKSQRGLRQGDPMSPLLFVICMEYLSRVLHSMSLLPLFQYHPRCKAVKLTHLCFADDLILCCKGDFASIYLLLQAFKLFSDTSGLQPNKQKSSIYCYGMSDSDINRVELVSGFTRSVLPFKYLGVPICSKKITTAQCDMLVDKMIARIKVWSSRNLSYSARMQLINSVLLSLHMYWAQVYVLPKQVLYEINKICRSFLWSGKAYNTKPSNISLAQSCCHKKEGGLGFRDVVKWNIALMGKYVWAVASKQDNVWIKWVNAVYVKDGVWWDYQPNASASWYWRKVCETKEILKQYYSQNEFSTIAQYSVKVVYEKLIEARPLVTWDMLVWNRLNVPRHRFICWMAVQARLQTTAKLARIGVSVSPLCLLCGQQDEDHNHLFFSCSYSQQCLNDIRSWMSIPGVSSDLQQITRGIDHSRHSHFKKQVWYAGLAAIVYVVWQCRNGSFWDKYVPTVQNSVKSIKHAVRDRIKVVMPKKVSRRDCTWFLALFQYRRDTAGLNRRLDLGAAPDHPLHVPFGEPGGPVLQQIREFDPLPNQPRSNPSWLPPPLTQPSSAGISAAVVTSTAARVTPPQVGMTTSTMVTAPASTPASRPLPPPMVTASMPLPVTLPAQGPTPAIQMPWDQLFSQQVVQPVVNLVTSTPGAPPQLMTAPLANQAPQAAFPNANAQMHPDSSRNYSPYTPLNRSVVPVSHGFVTPFPYVAGTHATQGTPPYMQQVVPQFTPHQP